MKKKTTYSAPSTTVVEVEARDIICESTTVSPPPMGGDIDLGGSWSGSSWGSVEQQDADN